MKIGVEMFDVGWLTRPLYTGFPEMVQNEEALNLFRGGRIIGQLARLILFCNGAEDKTVSG